MKYTLALIVLLLSNAGTYAQITSVNTACTGNPVTFTANKNEMTYTWITDTVNIDQVAGSFTPTSFFADRSVFASTNYDNGTWYTFINAHPANKMYRLTYSGSPNGAYTVSTVGTYGNSGMLEGLDIVKDPATGNWYGAAANGSEFFVLSFGNSLANTPTAVRHDFSSVNMSWPHQVGLAKYGSDWIAFIGDRNSSIKRADFGTSLSNTPVATTIPNVGSVAEPCNFAIHKENGNWYMLVASLVNSTITRYDFGTNIANNAPTGTLLPNPGGILKLIRSICIVSNCNQLIALALNEDKELVKLDFNNSIKNTPTASKISTGIDKQNSLNTYFVDSVMYGNIVSFGSLSFSQCKLITFPVGSGTTYYNDTFNHSFSTGGNKNLTLYINQGSHMGSEAFCKSINITPGKVLRDTATCEGQALVLDASAANATGYLWSTNAITPSITVTTPGKYWVTYTGSSCSTADTINFTLKPLPVAGYKLSATGNGFVCVSAAGVTYQWYKADGTPIPGETKDTYYPSDSGLFYVIVTDSYGCSTRLQNIDRTYKPESIGSTPGSSVNVYPNPFNNRLAINNTADATHYKVLNVMGRQLASGNLQKGLNVIVTQQLPAGYYNLVVTAANGQIQNFRVVKVE